MKVVSSQALIILIVGLVCAGCDLVTPPAPQAKSGIAKSGGASTGSTFINNNATGGPKIWRKQTCSGLTFEAPFEVKLDPTIETQLSADGKAGMTDLQGFVGHSEEDKSLQGVRIHIVRFNSNPAFAANMEQAMHKTFQEGMRKHGEPNPQYTVLWTQFGAASGYRLTYAKTTGGDPRVIEGIVAASGGTFWRADLESGSLSQRDTIKKIVDSMSIQP